MKIFVVEDDPWFADIIEYHLLLNPENEVEKFTTAEDCLKNLYKNPSVITLDYSLPDMKGELILKKIKDYNSNLPVIIISGQDDISTAIQLLKQGAYDYITKDENTKDRLWASMTHLQKNINLQKENIVLKEEIVKKYKYDNIIKGNSKPIKDLFKLMDRAVDNNITVSITGETGTGKELVAKAIHYNSKRHKHSFTAINVGSVPEGLLESELFGHEKGSFTNAITRRIGKFEEAHKGTLFLDEIAEMNMSMQTKLLRVLQEKEIFRIGSNKPIKMDIRLITATHKNLAEEVKIGNFRKDLYYRILGLPIQLPPLREREQDILVLAKFFMNEFCKENKRSALTFTEGAKQKLLTHQFAGNIRELKSVIELAIIMSNDNVISEQEVGFSTMDTLSDIMQTEATLEDYNVQIIKHFLEKYNKDAILVSKKLGVAKSTIYRYINNHHL